MTNYALQNKDNRFTGPSRACRKTCSAPFCRGVSNDAAPMRISTVALGVKFSLNIYSICLMDHIKELVYEAGCQMFSAEVCILQSRCCSISEALQ